MDIEKFFEQPYTDRQLVKFVDDSKSEERPLWVAILENDKLFVAPAAGIVGATRLISIPIKKLLNKSEPDIPGSESDNLLQFLSLKKARERLLTSLKEGTSDRGTATLTGEKVRRT